MNFGPAEMAQTMDGAKALLTFAMVSSISIGLVLGVIVAFFWEIESRSSRATIDERAVADP